MQLGNPQRPDMSTVLESSRNKYPLTNPGSVGQCPPQQDIKYKKTMLQQLRQQGGYYHRR